MDAFSTTAVTGCQVGRTFFPRDKPPGFFGLARHFRLDFLIRPSPSIRLQEFVLRECRSNKTLQAIQAVQRRLPSAGLVKFKGSPLT